MYFELSKSGNPRFAKIHPLLAEILQAVAVDPWERFPKGSMRLLPTPGDDEGLRMDWVDIVQPELRRHFESERAIVAKDLNLMKQVIGKNPTWSLEILKSHSNAWLTTLNAYRLALVSEHSITETELANKGEPDFFSKRGFVLMQVNFFAFIQECLIRGLEGSDDISEFEDEGEE